MKAHGVVEVQLHSFLTSALDDSSFHLWVSAPNIHSLDGWVGHWADLDALENRKTCCPCWESNHISLVIHYTDYSSPASIINTLPLGHTKMRDCYPTRCWWVTHFYIFLHDILYMHFSDGLAQFSLQGYRQLDAGCLCLKLQINRLVMTSYF